MLAVVTVSDLNSPTRKTRVLRHDYQNYTSPTKLKFQNYQVQIGGSELRFKGKSDTSLTNVVVQPSLFAKVGAAALHKAVIAMHKYSYNFEVTVLLAEDNEQGDAWIMARGGTPPSRK